MFDSIFIVPKLNDRDSPRVQVVVQEVVAVAISNNVILVDETHINSDTLVIALGGDGTMLEAMKVAAAKGATAIGVNLGNVGFLTDFTTTGFVEELNLILNTKDNLKKFYKVEERISLEAYSDVSGNSIIYKGAFNEFVFSNVYSDTHIKYHLQIGDTDAGVHRANSLIVGTPTGSTAYSLAAGGGLILPTMQAIQIIPIAPCSMSSRPIIVPGVGYVRVTILETEGEWVLKRDGSTVQKYWKSLPVTITMSDNKVKLLHHKSWSFFQMLTNKLHWKTI